jgi:hypothetical protein
MVLGFDFDRLKIVDYHSKQDIPKRASTQKKRPTLQTARMGLVDPYR